ncbi:MAG: DUF89 family protein [Ruminococcaceae bacterium]|nr:DUF89 family protein [Oscillospiraceae bacterium]
MILFNTECFLCQLKRNVETARKLGNEQTATAFCRELMQLFATVGEDVPSPGLAPEISGLFQKYYGLPIDRFQEEKRQANEFVLARMDAIRAHIEAADEPLLAALQCAILGNYLDFAVLQKDLSFALLDDMLRSSGDMELDMDAFEQFRQELAKGKKLLYLTDNAGEIGFDRLFAERIKAEYPQLEIIVCVRGGPAQNDAMRIDAERVGMPFPVIDNGNSVPGTMLARLSKEAKTAMDEADVILSKGQANVETLYGNGYNVYYAFLIKCGRFEKLFGKKMLTPMFVREPK